MSSEELKAHGRCSIYDCFLPAIDNAMAVDGFGRLLRIRWCEEHAPVAEDSSCLSAGSQGRHNSRDGVSCALCGRWFQSSLKEASRQMSERKDEVRLGVYVEATIRGTVVAGVADAADPTKLGKVAVFVTVPDGIPDIHFGQPGVWVWLHPDDVQPVDPRSLSSVKEESP